MDKVVMKNGELPENANILSSDQIKCHEFKILFDHF
jgi:hypothetical protein